MTEAMDEIIDSYKDVAPDVTIIPTYDSSGKGQTGYRQGLQPRQSPPSTMAARLAFVTGTSAMIRGRTRSKAD